ncbi:MAG: DNA polymerase I [Crocinitomicaceae bacterium]|nr:DNA polymerase I [Crocinitomicaceae bacterium]MCF8410119.1 DNA polymerase I [Crocinitomicaceae bacterium]MCF8443504.1 DNA polymerase I [Crocinitomicaceae bacterium]
MLSAESPRKLFLLDAYALIYRAYFAFAKNPRINSQGQNTSAAFGFTNVLIDILKTEKPTHIAVVFDPPGGSTMRQEEFEAYKAHREEMPEDIRSMIQPIKRIVEAFNIPRLEVTGYEADDVIGTIAWKAEAEGFLTYMMTPDKDYAQLVTDNCLIYKPGRGGNPPEIMGVKEVCAKFEVENPLQVIDILGLWGDAADNIPGIPGIGEKTSKQLIKIYGSVENLIDNAHQLKGKQQENVRNFADQGLVSKMLATIITDVEIEFDEQALLVEPVDADKIREVFTELEFVSLAKRIIGEEIVVSTSPKNTSVPHSENQLDLFGAQSMLEPQEPIETASYKTIATEKPSYHLISTATERHELIELLLKQKQVCFDTETTDIDALHADLVGFSFSYKAREGFYVAVPEDFEEAKKIIEEFKPFFESSSIEKIAHNIKYDLKVLNRYGIAVSEPTFDTMIAHYLINPESKQGMDFLANYYLSYQPISIETLIGKKGKNQGNMRDLSPEEIADYASEDADITFQLKQILEPEIQKDHLKELFYRMEMPLVEVLKDMEQEGIAIDVKALQDYSKELEKTLLRLDEEIKTLAGVDFNVDSPKQLGEVLFDHLKISSKAKKTKTGQYATSEDVLMKHEKDHPIVPLILEFRQLRKLKSTYIDPLPTLCDKVDGRIHTNFMQTVTATGRLSSNNPNLQNIPIRSAKGKEIRRAFVPRSADYHLMAADYSQIELRIIAALSGDKNMIQAFQQGVDIHTATAAKVFNIALDTVTRDQRSAAKAVNFGIIYGQSAFGLSQTLNISRTEAKTIIDSYFEQFGQLKSYMDGVIHMAREKGYVETIMKRRRYLPDINSANAVVRGFAERNAINAPIQGSAADIIKMAMIAVHKSMKKEGVQSKMILQVHDELVFDIHHSEKTIMQDLVRDSMEKAISLIVPMEVEIQVANNWLEAH